MSTNTHYPPRRPGSPAKRSLRPTPADEGDPMEIDEAQPQRPQSNSRPPSRSATTQPPQTSLSRRSSIKAGAQQGPQQKQAGTRSQENEVPRSQPVNASERIQELERLAEEQRTLIKDLTSERENLAAQAERNWKSWKQTARELRKATQVPAYYQVTDSQLTGLIMQLRYSIRDFAVQYFTGNSRVQLSNEGHDNFESCMVRTTPGTDAFKQYLKSSSRCASVIQAILWRLLKREVFGKFAWAGKAGESLCDLRYYLQYAYRNEPISDPDLDRKFQLWSAEATALIMQMCDFTDGSQESKRAQSMRKGIRNDFWSVAAPYLSTHSDAAGQELRRILNNALALDREIHRQTARVTWEFPPEDAQVRFKPGFMEAEKGEQRPRPEQQVILIVAPAVRKRGKSDGQGFDAEEQLLVPMEVSCQLPTDVQESTFGMVISGIAHYIGR